MKKIITITAIIFNLALISSPSFAASTNLKCESSVTKSLKLFLNLSDAVGGKGQVSLGLGSNVNPQKALTGTYNVFFGQPNTRLAGTNIVTGSALGLIDRNTQIVAHIELYVRAHDSLLASPFEDVTSADAEFGYNNQGNFVSLEKYSLNCKSLN